MTNSDRRRFCATLGLAPRALAEYVAQGAPTNSPDAFLSWFIAHHQQKRLHHAPPELKAA